jgi:hypothetical protein
MGVYPVVLLKGILNGLGLGEMKRESELEKIHYKKNRF